MGVVWRAVDERLERSVAVKKMVGQHGLSPADRAELRARAQREAKNAARLQHANAIMVFDITEHEGDPCLVMEYLPSRSLSELLAEQGTLPLTEVARIGEQVASALVAAHQAGIVHRDVKPGNILIADGTRTAKLTDFGISRAQGDMTLTATGLVGGTPAYLAPELARGVDPSPQSDVFALGATLYHAIEGQSPWGNNPNQLAVLHTAASGKVVPPQHAGPATELLMSMLRKEPGERIAMADAAQGLRRLAAGGTPQVPAAVGRAAGLLPTERPAAPPWQRTQAVPAAGAGRQGTAMFDPVADQAAPPPRGPQRSAGNGKLIAGILALVAAVVVAIVLLMNGSEETPPPVADDKKQEPTTTQQTTTPPDNNEPIDWTQAGNVVVEFYDFPDGVDKSWELLTPNAKQAYNGDKEEFREYWTGEYSAVWPKEARKQDTAPGSVLMKVDMYYIKKGDDKEEKEKRYVRVIRHEGQLMIDSDPRVDDADDLATDNND